MVHINNGSKDNIVKYNELLNDVRKKDEVSYDVSDDDFDFDDDDEEPDCEHCDNGIGIWVIPADQIVKIQNRISDIREVANDDPIGFIKATYDLIGTLDTIIFDNRNYKWIPECCMEDED